MHIFVCVDDRLGMTFGGRRQSRDRVVIADMLASAAGRLTVGAFSADLFPEAQVTVAPDFPPVAPQCCCFFENIDPAPYAGVIERVTLYRWNRRYPADLRFTLPLDPPQWRLQHSEALTGYSHPEITKEVYVKCL